MRQFEQWQDMISRLYPETLDIAQESNMNIDRVLSQTVTFQVTDDCNLACCFVAGTKVLMSDGIEKNIEDIELGDRIVSFNEDIGFNIESTVEQFFCLTDKVITIHFKDNTQITGTLNHEMFTTTGVKTLSDIAIDDVLITYNGLNKVVSSIDSEPIETIVYNIGVTPNHTYIANGLLTKNCYCYQIHKGKRRMSFETAKKYIDLIISGEKGFSSYINPILSPGIIIEFIGGEPFMEIELIDQICDYFSNQLIEKQHPWATKYMFSICSNGVLYFDEKVQRFLRKWNGHLSFSVTIDGNKELHDSCRIFPDGRPSYDLAVAAAKDWMSRGYYMGSKITIAPENVTFLFDAIKHMTELGYTEINANCIYEKGWEPKHATVLYEEMKKVSDYFLENDFDFENDYYCALYNENFFKPKEETDLQNWCFRADTKILTPKGNVNIETLKIGDIVISATGKERKIEKVMKRYTNDTCVVIAEGVEDIYTTINHPFLIRRYLGNDEWDEGSCWVEVGNIRPYDMLGYYENEYIKWIPIVAVNPVNGYEVYNITVAEEHTYIANNVIVHNCGGNGLMLSCDPDGWLFPCLRYMESSLGDDQKPYSIGHVDTGIGQCDCDQCRIDCLRKIDRRTQSTDECFNCPIAEGCSWWITPTIVVTL